MQISQKRIKRIIKEELSNAYKRDDEGVRMKKHLSGIMDIASQMVEHFEDDEEVEEWVQEKIAVVAAMLQSIHDYKKFEQVRSK